MHSRILAVRRLFVRAQPDLVFTIGMIDDSRRV
jgi:hypothetical protein